ncbi:PaaI family thioesterase [Sneathiella chinensis]|nr:PaaI family thioesterase [Sneathiella chinensis]
MSDISIPEGFRKYHSPKRFPEKIGPLYFKKEDEDLYRFGFFADETHCNANGIIHGGMMMSFMDETLGQMVWRATGRKPCATISLNFDFVSSAKPGEWLEMKGHITRQGVSVVFIRGELYAGDRIVLTADGIWKVLGR